MPERGPKFGQVVFDDSVAIAHPTAERELWPRAVDLLAAALTPLPSEMTSWLREVQREPAREEPEERATTGILLPGRDLLERDRRRRRTDGPLVAMCMTGVMSPAANKYRARAARASSTSDCNITGYGGRPGPLDALDLRETGVGLAHV